MRVLLISSLLAFASCSDYKSRAKELISKMTLDEKITMLYGVGSPYVGATANISRLGIPQLKLNDGPQGFRDEDCKGEFQGCTTDFPSGITVAATFDVEMASKWGKAMGLEFAQKGSNVQLGPGLNVARVPLNGRNFEYCSGEDPFLGATIVPLVIKGIQSNGVIANMKHYVLNNQETDRGSVNSIVDERTRWEVYYPPFQSAVDAGVGSAMCSYNRINGVYSCENDVTLRDLKEGMKFEGWVMSDWGATHSTELSAHAGLDQQMPDASFFGDNLKNAVVNGEVSLEEINDKVFRILSQMFKVGLFEKNRIVGDKQANVTSVAHNDIAMEIAQASTVLLKNDNNFLPLNVNKVKKIAIIGSAAQEKPVVKGGGSGNVYPAHIITLVQGITSYVQGKVEVTYFGTPANDNDWAKINANIADVDAVVVAIGTSSSEGGDRSTLAFGDDENSMVEILAASVGKKVVVYLTSPGAVLLPFADDVAAIFSCFMPGQEQGRAFSNVLFGKVSPSGKLPVTFPNVDNEINFSVEQYPGVMNKEKNFNEAVYSERLLIGYRYYDYHQITPRFPFGHGLSYATFQYSQLKIVSNSNGFASVSFKIANTHEERDAAEIPQLYLTFPPPAKASDIYLEAPKQLKGFKKVFIPSGESKIVTLNLEPRDFSFWDLDTHSFVVRQGEFTISIGQSSRNILLTGKAEISTTTAVIA